MKLKVNTLKGLLLYNYRYIAAYAVVFGFGLYFLTWRLGTIAPGLSDNELATAANNVSISSILNQPIYPLHSLLQWISTSLFGVTTISLRLPSVLLAGLVAFLLYNLLKKWFGKVTALISVALLLSADWYLFVARLGTGAIEFSLWFTILLFALIKLLEKRYWWLVAYAGAFSLLLFIPYGVYAAITTTAGLFLCAMFRKRVNEAPAQIKTISAFIALLGIAAAIFASFNNPTFAKSMLGIITIPTWYQYFKNLVLNTSGLVMLWPDNNPLLGPTGIFLIRFFEFIFMLFGLIILWVTRVNRLNLIIIANAVVLSLVGGLTSSSRGGSLLLVPGAIFMTAGLRHFIHRWQRTFPNNPYAKVALLAPLAIMVVTTVTLHYQSYFVLWPHQTSTHSVFKKDFALLKEELSKPGTCIVVGATAPTETLLATPVCKTTFQDARTEDTIALQPGTRIITARSRVPKNLGPTKALVSETKEASVRWQVTQVE